VALFGESAAVAHSTAASSSRSRTIERQLLLLQARSFP
jgi:hypothetical protein